MTKLRRFKKDGEGNLAGYWEITILETYQSKNGEPMALCHILDILGGEEVRPIHMKTIEEDLFLNCFKWIKK